LAEAPLVASLGDPEPGTAFAVQPFAAELLERYWLHFELTSVLLLAAVVAAIAVIRSGRRHDG
jgi:NADH-quinone oxidoreductase subunit J